NHQSTFDYDVESGGALAGGGDLQKVTGDLNLSGAVALTFADLNVSPTAFAVGTTFTLINYSGNWNNGLFSYNAVALADGALFNTGLNLWQIDYNATVGGSNFSGEYAGGSFVNITAAVPEPTTFLLLAVGGLVTLVFRRRRA
ncbi:MAG: PEP-CTERM sorting domain-containing protein, partial [Terrimicrobiaceae bacterium]